MSTGVIGFHRKIRGGEQALLLVAALSCAGALPPATAQQRDSLSPEESREHARRMARGIELFKQEVRPLLVERCLPCHGGGQTMGGFDLADRDSLVSSGKISETPAESRLLELIRHQQEPHMPFQQAKLPGEAIASIARWLELGAPYDDPLVDRPPEGPLQVSDEHRRFWSFRPLAPNTSLAPDATSRQAPTENGDWAGSPIDRSILEKLREKGLTPNPAADRRTLIRRAYLDLLGLPPAPSEVDAFVNDTSAGAWEGLIDQLLESPHYGERWARHWMDIVRFAESYGFESDYDRPYAYRYRDFLIQALNQDMPYDQFVRWQLAGDELAPDSPPALAATGFLGAGAFPTQITEAEFETARYDELDDMIGTMGAAMLGLTVGCARCHDHKYDPIPTRDYYRVVSVFGRTIRSEIDYFPDQDEYRQAKAEWEAEHSALHEERAQYERRHLSGRFGSWLGDIAQNGPPSLAGGESWQILDLTEFRSSGGAELRELEDGSILAAGPNPEFDTYTFIAETAARGITSIRVEALADPSLPHHGPGRSRSGRFQLGTIQVKVQPLADEQVEPVEAELARGRATAELDSDAGSAQRSLPGNNITLGWTLRPSGVGADQAGVFDFAEPVGFEGGTRLIVQLRFHYNTQYAMGRTRLSVSTADRPEAKPAEPKPAEPKPGGSVPQRVVEGLEALKSRGPAALSADERKALFRWFAGSDEGWRNHDATLDAHRSKRPLSPKTKIQVTGDGFPLPRHDARDRGYPHFYKETHFLGRGNASNKGGVATPGFLQVLMPSGRDETHWRVSAPPLWQRGGFHRASLARWITDVEGGGALLARVIVNRLWHHHFGRGIVATPSDFGMQGARPTHPELLDWLARDLVDHGWRLKRLHKMIMLSATYRLSAHRDPEKAALDIDNLYRWRWTPRRIEAEAVRDSLLKTAGLLDERMFGPGSLDEKMRRRSVYFFIKRTELIPSMMLFDWPEHLVGIGRRPSTTVAPQALMFLNSPEARHYAEGLARRLDGLRGPRMINEAYRIAYGRPAVYAEVAAGKKFIEKQRRSYESEGETDAAWTARTDYCQTLLGLNEFLYIR